MTVSGLHAGTLMLLFRSAFAAAFCKAILRADAGNAFFGFWPPVGGRMRRAAFCGCVRIICISVLRRDRCMTELPGGLFRAARVRSFSQRYCFREHRPSTVSGCVPERSCTHNSTGLRKNQAICGRFGDKHNPHRKTLGEIPCNLFCVLE